MNRRIDKLCQKYSVQTLKQLEELATADDQALMRSGRWDYKVDSLNTRIVNDVKRIPRVELVGDEKWRLEQIIWFWYHHAVSCAIFRYKDREKALHFVRKALRYQKRIGGHPNKITQLLHLLLLGKIEEAKTLVPTMNEDEIETGKELVEKWNM